MTILAWDGKTLAADKRMEQAGLARTVTKIFSHGKILIGISGGMCQCLEMVAWIKNGSKPEEFPQSQRGDDWSTVVVISQEGVDVFEKTPYPIRIEDNYYATGSGRDYALAAMHCGKTAAEAVEIACLFDVGCGNGIDTLGLLP